MFKETRTAAEQNALRNLIGEMKSGKLTRREALVKGGAIGLGLASMTTIWSTFAPASLAQDSTPDPNIKTGGTLKVGLSADPANLDPHITSLTAAWHVIEFVYDGLVTTNAALEPEPALAESWEISEDGITYTFHLRQGVKFHNGRDFVAEDVIYSFNRIVDPATASPNSSDLASIAVLDEESGTPVATPVGQAPKLAIEAPDPATVVITLKSPDASFISKLMGSSMAIVPKEEVEANTDLKQVMVGTGPFKFVEYLPQTRVTLEKNAEFWDAGKPYLDGLDLEIVPDPNTRQTALVSGTVDFIEYAPVQSLEIFRSDSSLVVTGDQNTNIRYMALNIQREPFSKLEVRQAIAKVIDRGPIIDSAVFGGGIPTVTIFPASFWAGQEIEIPAPDIEGAKALLATAGVPDGFKATIHSWAQYPFLSNAALVIQEQLKQVGIELDTDFQENAIYLDNYFAGNFDLSVTGTSAYVDPNDVIQGNFGTGESNNGIKYSNPEVDDLIKQGVATTDQAARAEIYHQIQDILLQDLPWINLFIASQYEAMKTYVMGYVHIATGSNSSIREVWLDQ